MTALVVDLLSNVGPVSNELERGRIERRYGRKRLTCNEDEERWSAPSDGAGEQEIRPPEMRTRTLQ